MSKFDVWVLSFSTGGPPPAQRLKHAFGIDDTSARAIEQRLPRVIKHAVGAKEAGEMRKVLESIGAEVDCRPARAAKSTTNPNAAVFRRPSDELLPGRVSAIDPFAPAEEAGVPRISVEDPAESDLPASPSEISGVVRPPSAVSPRSVDAAMRERSLARQRKIFMRRAAGAIIAGVIMVTIGLVTRNSVFMGTADWVGIVVDTLGIYLLGVGGWDLYQERKRP